MQKHMSELQHGTSHMLVRPELVESAKKLTIEEVRAENVNYWAAAAYTAHQPHLPTQSGVTDKAAMSTTRIVLHTGVD